MKGELLGGAQRAYCYFPLRGWGIKVFKLSLGFMKTLLSKE